ncbi:MAG: hypothetical protein ACOC4G_10220, partial [Bacillota bacterium]
KLFSLMGAIIPDIIDGSYSLINPEAWYNGNLIFFWHRSNGNFYAQTIGATLAISVSLYYFRFYLMPYIIKLNKIPGRKKTN